MEGSVYAHMTRFSLAPMYDGISAFVGSHRVYLHAYMCVCISCWGVCACFHGMYGGTVVCTGVCERCERESSK